MKMSELGDKYPNISSIQFLNNMYMVRVEFMMPSFLFGSSSYIDLDFYSLEEADIYLQNNIRYLEIEYLKKLCGYYYNLASNQRKELRLLNNKVVKK